MLILVQNLPCLKCVFTSVLKSRSSLQNLCFYLRSVLRVLHEYKIQINVQCKAFETSLHLHNIIVAHAKHFSLSDICPVGKEDGKMSSLSQLPFLLCSAVVVHQLIVNTATALNVLISPFFVSCLFTQTDRLEQAMVFHTEQ